MRKLLTGLVSQVVLAGGAALAQDAPDADLLARAAVNRHSADARPSAAAAHADGRASVAATPVGAVPGAAGDLNAEERAAREALTLSQARLDLIMARRELRQNQPRAAAQHAQRVLGWLATLADKTAGEELALQAEGIVARAKSAGVDAGVIVAAAQADASSATAPSAVIRDEVHRRADSAAELARQYSGADTPEVDTRVNAELLRERALRNQRGAHGEYQPGREVFDRERLDRRDEQRLPYQAALDDAVKSDELRRLVELDEARIAPQSWIGYPDGWREQIAARSAYEGGQIARSGAWTDANGREWYAALYDIRDLTYVPPDFQPPLSLDPAQQLRETLDRDALRRGSMIFNGGAYDLAAGIPLLRFFGGIDDWEIRGAKYSRARQAQIVEMMRAFTTQVSEPKIISLPPDQ